MFGLSFTFLNIGNIVIITVLKSLSMNSSIFVFLGLFLLTDTSPFFVCLVIFLSGARHCDFYLMEFWIFSYSFQYAFWFSMCFDPFQDFCCCF